MKVIRTNRPPEKVVTTEWHNIVVRNKLAEICEKYLKKGDKVYCEGRIKTRQWEQEGVKRYTTEIHVGDMTFLSVPNASNTPSSNSLKEESESSSADIEGDLPF